MNQRAATMAHLQNRVDPWGQLHAVPDHGTLMGNRGILHGAARTIRRQWAHKAWVICLLDFGNIKRNVFSPGNYSELFFLDEATAFAAGHRPCNFCQRDRSRLFKDSWFAENAKGSTTTSIREVDSVLHAERTASSKDELTYSSKIASLPTGTIFSAANQAYLVNGDRHHPWSFRGYGNPLRLPAESMVEVLTPPSIVRMYAGGLVPTLHPSSVASGGMNT